MSGLRKDYLSRFQLRHSPFRKEVLKVVGYNNRVTQCYMSEDIFFRVPNRLRKENMQELLVESKENVIFLKKIKCYRGSRHAKRLPSRGQRTRTNSSTRKKSTLNV
jgi:small subunit ribosomal protein S13